MCKYEAWLFCFRSPLSKAKKLNIKRHTIPDIEKLNGPGISIFKFYQNIKTVGCDERYKTTW